MSRAKLPPNMEVCGDCGASDATWAAVNKGILLCTQCCSIHRSLGRHISIVKSLQKSEWHPNELAMVCTLNNNGANNIWEHALLENSNGKSIKKKPSPGDPIHVKSEYIKAKHSQCAFAFREGFEDGLISVENELGKQLHASVRTPNLETSFRLLILGADPNYFHDEKASTPLHVAVKGDQKLQAELLLVYGADPTYPDSHGRTPVDYAKEHASKELYNRLVESQYELTDSFTRYLTHRKPDHQNGVHLQVPQVGFESHLTSLMKLQKMPNHIFEELAMDVYEEIDRRDTEAIWFSCVDAIDLNVVPFLPVDPTLSATRNQGRQKLARFTTPELKNLVYDILIDTQRRQMLVDRGGSYLGSLPQLREFSQISNDDPLYDSVASDEDYVILPPVAVEEAKIPKNDEAKIQKQNDEAKIQKQNDEAKIQKQNDEAKIQKQNDEAKIQKHNDTISQLSNALAIGVDFKQNRKHMRPSSMYETREGIKTPNWHLVKNQMKQNEPPRTATHSLGASIEIRQTILGCTELITKSIQHLCRSIQELDNEDCVSRGEEVKSAIVKLVTVLPRDVEGETITWMVDVLPPLLLECSLLQAAHSKGDPKAVENHLGKIRQHAFHLARYTKDVVTKYTLGQ